MELGRCRGMAKRDKQDMIDTTINDNGRIVRATYEGGEYIELHIGHPEMPVGEVINVWDYETWTPSIACTEDDVLGAVQDWIMQSDIDWPEWYEGYMDNVRA